MPSVPRNSLRSPALGLTLATALSWSGTAAADDALTCDFFMMALGAIPLGDLEGAFSSGKPLAPNLLGCLEERGAPARMLDALRRHLGRPEQAGGGAVLLVDSTDATWPESVGRRIADQTRLLAPGARPSAILFRTEDVSTLPWWYLEFRDRVSGALRDRLPVGSEAADHPSVLDADAVELLDANDRADAEQRLAKMGYRRTLILAEAPSATADGVLDLTVTVRDLDADGFGTDRDAGTIRLLRSENAGDDVEVTASLSRTTAEPGAAIGLSVALMDPVSGDPVDGRRLEAISGGRPLPFERVAPGRFSVEITLPPKDRIPLDPTVADGSMGVWTVSWTYTRDDGGLATHETTIPVALQQIIIADQRTELGDGRVHLTLDAGAGYFWSTGGVSGARLTGNKNFEADRSGNPFLGEDTIAERVLWDSAAGVRVPLGLTMVWKYVTFGADVGIRMPLKRTAPTWLSDHPWLTDDSKLVRFRTKPTFAVDLGAALQVGGWIDAGAKQPDRIGLFAGVWGGWSLVNARGDLLDIQDPQYARFTQEADVLFAWRGGGAVLGPKVSLHAHIADRFGVTLDVLAHAWSAKQGPVSPFVTSQLRLWVRLM